MANRDGWIPYTPEALKEIRLELDYSLAETAQRSGLHPRTLHRHERGTAAWSTLEAIARGYHVTICIGPEGIWIRRDPLP